MKKLMITLSAAALAFGAFAEDAGAVIAGENFNGLAVLPATVTNAGESAISTTPFTFSKENSAGTPDQFRMAEALENMAIKTKLDAPAYYSLPSAQAMAGVYFDSLVKFTACDEDAVVPAGSDAKIMVWVKEDETAGKTNIMVTAGYFNDALGGIEAKNYVCGAPSNYDIADDNDWCRLTIKAVSDITAGGNIAGFVLFVNAKPLTIAANKDIGVDGSAKDNLNKVCKIWAKDDRLFPSLVAGQTISSVGFAGQGAVDDISFTTIEPKDAQGVAFALDPVPAIATVGGVDAISIEDLNQKIKDAVGGAEVVLVDDIVGDIVFENENACTLDLNGFTITGAISSEAGKTVTISNSGEVIGKIDGTLTSGDDLFVLAGGKVNVSANSDFTDNVEPATGLEFITVDEGAYYTVAEPQEDGTAAKPWTINTAADLTSKLLANYATLGAEHNNYVLTADIDMSTAGNWDGPGESRQGKVSGTDYFTGVFDGAGHTIYGLTLAKKEYNGFFGNLGGAAQVKNLTIIITGFGGETPSGGSFGAAGVAGYSEGSDVLIENVTVKGTAVETVLSGTHNMGGIGCRLEGKITIKNCTNELNIATTYSKIGGMCAIASNRDAAGDIIFDGCVNKGSVTALENTAHDAGKDGCAGIIGYIQNAAEGSVAGAADKQLTIKNCQNLGVISTSDASNKSAKIASLLSFPQSCTYGDLTGNVVDTRYVAVGNLTKVPPSLLFAANDAFVPTASLDKTGSTQYKVMAAGAPVSLALGESINLDETLKAATVTAAAAANKVTKSGTVYTCVAKPAVTTVTLAAATVEYGSTVAPAATVKDADGNVIDAANYDLSYSPALTATTPIRTQITVTATAKGDNYVGSAEATFTVVQKVISVGVTVDPVEATWAADGLVLPTPAITGVDGLTLGTDYTAAWDKELPEENPTENVVLTYTVTPTGNYSGTSAKATFTVKPAAAQEDYPEDIKTTDPEVKAAFDAWANKHGLSGDAKAKANVNAFILDLAPDATEEAIQAEIAKNIDQDLVDALVAGDTTDALAAIAEKYPNAKVELVPAAELPDAEDGSAVFRRLKISVKQPAN